MYRVFCIYLPLISDLFGNLLVDEFLWLIYGIVVIAGTSSLYFERENEYLDPDGYLEKIESFTSPYFLCWNVTMINMVFQFGV